MTIRSRKRPRKHSDPRYLYLRYKRSLNYGLEPRQVPPSTADFRLPGHPSVTVPNGLVAAVNPADTIPTSMFNVDMLGSSPAYVEPTMSTLFATEGSGRYVASKTTSGSSYVYGNLGESCGLLLGRSNGGGRGPRSHHCPGSSDQECLEIVRPSLWLESPFPELGVSAE
jgi:hypothetical protein